jgi:dTDP-4-dehydrorhamnose 3,5-epimerase
MSTGSFQVDDLRLAGLKRVVRTIRGDHRGYLSRLYCGQELVAAGFDVPIAQINQTLTRRRGSIRGLHFQRPPHAEDKFVSVLRGEILDVAVDLRAGSPTFGQWHGEHLTAENRVSLFIPRGFAHGFQTLTDACELLYLHTHPYTPSAEGGIDPFDPTIDIRWPLPVSDMSDRDRDHPPLDADFERLTV